MNHEEFRQSLKNDNELMLRFSYRWFIGPLDFTYRSFLQHMVWVCDYDEELDTYSFVEDNKIKLVIDPDFYYRTFLKNDNGEDTPIFKAVEKEVIVYDMDYYKKILILKNG